MLKQLQSSKTHEKKHTKKHTYRFRKQIFRREVLGRVEDEGELGNGLEEQPLEVTLHSQKGIGDEHGVTTTCTEK